MIGTFGSVQLEMNLIYYVNALFQKWQIFGTPSFTSGSDKDMGLLSFFRKFYFTQFLFEAFFKTIDNFGNLQPQKEGSYILIPLHGKCWPPPSSTPGGDKDLLPLSFCRKFNSEQLSVEAFFDIINHFCSVQP